MRLYLSSFDLGNQPEKLVALVGPKRRFAVVGNALDNCPEARRAWVDKQTERLEHLGFNVSELDLRAYFGRRGDLTKRLEGLDGLWITAGNAFILRRAMRQSRFDCVVKQALARDETVYAGFSAATVVVAPSLRGLECVDDPDEVPEGYDAEIVWEGLDWCRSRSQFMLAVSRETSRTSCHRVREATESGQLRSSSAAAISAIRKVAAA